MNKLDKKQIPQFAALCVLSAGVFGYFVVKIVTPSPAAAGTRPHPVAEPAAAASTPPPASAKKAGPGKAETGPDVAAAGDETEAPAPTPGMRDPFVVGYVDTGTPAAPPTLPAAPVRAATASSAKPAKAAGPQAASIHEVAPAPFDAPAVPALPFGLKRLPSLGAAPAPPAAPKQAALEAPAAPTWTVTGVLQNEAGQVAVLRSGEARRIVRTGDFVDSVYRVVAVTRSAVVLRHGKTFYHLALGAVKLAPAETAIPPVPVPSPARIPAHGPGREPQDAALAPDGRPAGPESGLAEVIQAALLMARSYLAPAQAEVKVCLAAFHARTASSSRVATRFPDGPVPAPGSNEARACLERGRDLYGSGQRAEGRAQWRSVLAMDDLDAADEAGKLLDRYN